MPGTSLGGTLWTTPAGWRTCTDAEAETTFRASICDTPGETEIGVMECAPVAGECPEGCGAVGAIVYDPAEGCTRVSEQIACTSVGGGAESACAVATDGRIVFPSVVLFPSYYADWRPCTADESATLGNAAACE